MQAVNGQLPGFGGSKERCCSEAPCTRASRAVLLSLSKDLKLTFAENVKDVLGKTGEELQKEYDGLA